MPEGLKCNICHFEKILSIFKIALSFDTVHFTTLYMTYIDEYIIADIKLQIFGRFGCYLTNYH